HSIPAHSSQIQCVAVSPDGTLLASSDAGGDVIIWDAVTYQKVLKLDCSSPPYVISGIAFRQGGNGELATLDSGGTVKYWNPRTGQETLRLDLEAHEVRNLGFSSHGRWLAAANQHGVVRAWDAETGDEFLTIRDRNLPVTSLAFDPNGRTLVSTSGNEVNVWGLVPQEAAIFGGGWDKLQAYAFSPDSQRLSAAGGEDLTIRILDPRSCRELRRFSVGEDHCVHLSFNSNGNRLLFCGWRDLSDPMYCKVFDVESGRLLATHTSYGGPFFASVGAVDSSGKRIALREVNGPDDPRVTIWDTEDDRIVTSLRIADLFPMYFRFSPDGNRLLMLMGTL